jgi:competence protein ComEC
MLRADVLLVPHHGSRTSSSPEFLRAVGPSVAVIAVGYRNRFRHPAEEVLGRLSDRNVLRTDRDGAVEVVLAEGKLAVEGERRRGRRYWHDAPS